MEGLLQLLNIDPALIAKLFPAMLLVMGILSGLAMILNAVAKFTKTDADDKVAGFVGKGIAYCQKVIDFFSGNIKH